MLPTTTTTKVDLRMASNGEHSLHTPQYHRFTEAGTDFTDDTMGLIRSVHTYTYPPFPPVTALNSLH